MIYLIYKTQSEARERSLQQALKMGATAKNITQYWWRWRETRSGAWALCIPEDDMLMLTDGELSRVEYDVEFLPSTDI